MGTIGEQSTGDEMEYFWEREVMEHEVILVDTFDSHWDSNQYDIKKDLFDHFVEDKRRFETPSDL